MFNDDCQEVEQAFIASWDRIEQFYIVNCYLGTLEEWFNLTGRDLSRFDPARLETLKHNLSANNLQFAWLKPIRGLIAEMRQRGYDRQLRAGQTVEWLVLSRSREHGLRSEQARLTIMVLYEGGMPVKYRENLSGSSSTANLPITLQFDTVALHPELEQLLARLLVEPID